VLLEIVSKKDVPSTKVWPYLASALVSLPIKQLENKREL